MRYTNRHILLLLLLVVPQPQGLIVELFFLHYFSTFRFASKLIGVGGGFNILGVFS